MEPSCHLSKKTCTPCKGTAAPLKGAPLIVLQKQLDSSWKILDESWLEKEYLFHTFKQAVAFINQVAEIAEEQGHHPDILLSYNKIRLKIWTHKINGLSENDFILAAKCDASFTKGKLS